MVEVAGPALRPGEYPVCVTLDTHGCQSQLAVLDTAPATPYDDLVLGAPTRGGAPGAEAKMAGTADWYYVSELSRRIEQSREQGRVEGKAAALLTVLTLRGLAVSPAQRARIDACRDRARLERWIARAVTAASAAQALGERPRLAPAAPSAAPRRRRAVPARGR